jgi:NADPH-dependent glutamate synthase beta subunit-like oxidoreductase
MAAHDSSQPGSEGMPLRVAIIGSGPSGFYAADALLKSDLAVQVAMIEKLPAPYGLVRFGVAPDHSKIRSVINVYEKVAASGQFSYWGNVEVGRDVTVDELYEHFDALIFAFGQAGHSRGGPAAQLHRDELLRVVQRAPGIPRLRFRPEPRDRGRDRPGQRRDGRGADPGDAGR